MEYNKSNMDMAEVKRPKNTQTFSEWFIERVTSGEIVDTSGSQWRTTLRKGPADLLQLIGVEF